MLMGFLKPDSGSIRVNGQEITELNEDGMQQDPQAGHHGISERCAV